MLAFSASIRLMTFAGGFFRGFSTSISAPAAFCSTSASTRA